MSYILYDLKTATATGVSRNAPVFNSSTHYLHETHLRYYPLTLLSSYDLTGVVDTYLFERLRNSTEVLDFWDDREKALNLNLTGANLSGADLERAAFLNPKFAHRPECCANLSGANLSGARLDGAAFSNYEESLWRAKRPELPENTILIPESSLAGCNLTRANLSGARVERADFTRCNLTCADLTDVRLECASFAHAKLKNAQISAGSFSHVSFFGADLRGAEISAHVDSGRCEPEIRQVDFRNCNLAGVDLSGTYFLGCRFQGADLSGCNLSNSTFSHCETGDTIIDGANVDGFDYQFSLMEYHTKDWDFRKAVDVQKRRA